MKTETEDALVPKYVRTTNPTAHKSHECCECLGTINVGEKYEYVTGLWGTKHDWFRTCLDCTLVRARFSRYINYEELPFGSLRERMRKEKVTESELLAMP